MHRKPITVGWLLSKRRELMRKLIIVAVIGALVLASSALAADSITGRVRGHFVRSAYDGTLDTGKLKRYIKTPQSYVWCAWQDGKVVVHVRMKNTAAEHVTVNWYPRYSIKHGGVHGDGFTSAESDGFDPGEVRNLTAKEDPKGVKDNTRIATCSPHFQMLQSG
jgi:hypothetical protein